ncbi:MAG: CNNM domain-containing protein [Phycisphaerae bacterium]|nr:CNNM domain-containing protein [Phycisphaerae bacterium]
MIAAAEIFPWVLWSVIFLINAGMMGVLNGLEIGIYVLNKVRVELRAEAGNPQARKLRRLLQKPNRLLTVLLIGTNIHAYLAAFAVTCLFMLAGEGERAEMYTIMVTTPLLFVFSDSVPKNVYRKLAETLVYRLAWLLRAADTLFTWTGLSPLVRLFSEGLLRLLGQKKSHPSLLGHEGITAMLAEGHATGTLTFSQTNMAERVMSISHLHLSDVLTPAEEVIAMPHDVTYDEFLRRIARHSHSRLPLLKEDGQIAGIVDIYDVLTDDSRRQPAHWMTQPLRIPRTAGVTEALYLMQRSRHSLAVVTDEHDSYVGIVTIKDLVEEIVGEIEEW